MRPRLAVTAGVLLLAFALWTVWVLHRPAAGFEISMVKAIQSVGWGPVQATFPVFTLLAGPAQDVLAVAVIVVVAVLRRPATWLIVSAAGEGLIYSLLNQTLRRPRPSTHLVHVVSYGGGYGYPSGHAAFFLTFGALAVIGLTWRRSPAWGVALAAIAATLVLAAACLSRMYEGQHWPSDILGGLLLGGGWVCLVLSVRRISDPVLVR
jgi:undecaprenyl-diphosphatase